MNRNNIGRFSIDVKLINQDPLRIAKILAFMNFVPVRVELTYHNMYILYEGLSTLFKEVKQGVVPPFYELTITEDDGKIKSVFKSVSVKETHEHQN